MAVDSRTPFGMCPHGRGVRSPYKRGQQKPYGYDRAHDSASENKFQFVHPPYNGLFARCYPSAPRRQYCQLRGFRFASGSFCCPSVLLSCVPRSIEHTHIIPKRQNNASGVCSRAYNVIYIKRRFSCVIFTKTACAIGYFIV